MNNIDPLSDNNKDLSSITSQQTGTENLERSRVKRLFIYSFGSILIFFLGAFSLWFYQKLTSSKNIAYPPPTEKTLPPKKSQPTVPLPTQNIKTEIKTNDFLYIQDNQLWLGKADSNGTKPTIQKLTDKITSYVLSNSKDKVAYISDGYLKVRTIISNKEITLQKLIPDNYPQEVPEPEYIRALGNIAWSLDDTKLAFVGSNDAQADIYIIDIDGKNLKRLTNDKLNEFSLSWSPDNKKIAFQTTEGFGTGAGFSSSIVTINSDGDNYSQIAINGKLPGNHSFGPAENLRWINNNEIIFWAWTVVGPDGIWKADVNTKQIVPLTDKHGWSNPVWSEKNNSFLYPLMEKNFLIVNIKNGNKLVETSDEVSRVVWSYDGTKIAYNVKNNPNKPVNNPRELVYDLFIADADGSNPVKVISNAKFLLENFSFSSDNRMILYTKRLFEPDMHTEIWVINSDGTNDRQIDSASDLYGPHTTPYGNSAIYSKFSSTGGNQYIHYWLNLNTLSRETIFGNSGVSSPVFLAN
jgi:TolB protein